MTITADQVENVILETIKVYGWAVAVASLAMARLPQGKPGSLWDTVRTVVNWLANNWGHATNVREYPGQK